MRIPREIIDLVPFELAHAYRVVPVHRIAKKMVVALADPDDEEAIAEVEAFTGLEVLATIATDRAVNNALWRYYRRAI